jgi:hypothetical protein
MAPRARPAAEIASFEGAFVTNARGVAAVSQVDDTILPVDAARVQALVDAYDAVPWDPV